MHKADTILARKNGVKKQELLELGQNLIYFVVRVATGFTCLYVLTAITAANALLIQEWTLRSTGPFELTVL